MQNLFLYLIWIEYFNTCFDYCFTHSAFSQWASWGYLRWFSNSLEGLSWDSEPFSLHSAVSSQTISIGFRSGDWRPGHLAQKFITLLLGQINMTQPRVEPNANRMGWNVSPAKHLHTSSSSSIFHHGNHAPRNYQLTFSALHKDMASWTQDFKFGHINPNHISPRI